MKINADYQVSEFIPGAKVRRSGNLYRKDGWLQTVLEFWVKDGFFGGWRMSHTELAPTRWHHGDPCPRIGPCVVDWIEWSRNVDPMWRNEQAS